MSAADAFPHGDAGCDSRRKASGPRLRRGRAAALALVLAPAVGGTPADTSASVIPAGWPADSARDPVAAPRAWKPNTHLFAANLALRDALDDGRVTIPPYGEIAVPLEVLRALGAYPDHYRAGVVGPDVFPDVWTGQSFAHVDQSGDGGRWTSDGWMRHVLRTAREWGPEGPERDRALAFAYGYVTHAAGDVFGHSYVNAWAGGAWDWGRPTVVRRHVVLEAYVGAHTPPTVTEMAVWDRFVAEALIKHTRVRGQTPGAVHYRTFLELYDWLGPAVERAKAEMRKGLREDATYTEQCLAHPVWCGRKEFLETWHRDIDRGFRALVAANRELGAAIAEDRALDGVSALNRWAGEWIPKMAGGHAVGEAAAWIRAWDPLAPLLDPVEEQVMTWVTEALAREIELLRLLLDPASYMDESFPPGTRARVDAEMALGPDGRLRWERFAPLYNTVVLSKLALLDGAGLNELARRAGIARSVYAPDGHVLFATVKSMDGHRQWEGAPYGFLHVPYFAPPESQPGRRPVVPSAVRVGGRPTSTPAPTAVPSGGTAAGLALHPSGFALWGDPEVRTKVFGRIFKGFPELGPGPGPEVPDVAVPGPRPAAERPASPTIGRPMPAPKRPPLRPGAARP